MPRAHAYIPQSCFLLSSVTAPVFKHFSTSPRLDRTLPWYSRNTTAVLSQHYRGTLAALSRYSRSTAAVLSQHCRGILATLLRGLTDESKKCNCGVTRARRRRGFTVSIPSCDIRTETRQMIWIFQKKVLYLQVKLALTYIPIVSTQERMVRRNRMPVRKGPRNIIP